MVINSLLESLCASHRETLETQYGLMRQSSDWSLSCPAVVIDGRKTDTKASAVTVGTVNSVLSVSSAADNDLIKQWMALIPDRGVEAALEEMINGESGEAFAEAYEELRKERSERGRCLWTMDDASAFVMRSKEAYEREEMSCVAVLPEGNDDEWQVCTFSWRPNS